MGREREESEKGNPKKDEPKKEKMPHLKKRGGLMADKSRALQRESQFHLLVIENRGKEQLRKKAKTAWKRGIFVDSA